ncbi:YcxB family protein [uncultured Microscilla sp.]|uniref:YcxB family protein n=1 Tax=uncultured Microscilla sp. TaxID=432653 RepID=UPI00260D31DA|nr:YcxB family protein [uncultured Microscilla sp.]
MNLAYTLSENDFLTFQLFNVSTSGRLQKRKTRARILFPVAFLGLAIVFYLDSDTRMSAYFVGCALIFGLFYGKYMNWRYKFHYIKQVKHYYSDLFGNHIRIELQDDYIFTQDSTSEAKVKISEIEVINEISSHFFVKVSNANSLIIPKNQQVDALALKNRFKELNIDINECLDWKWS